MTKGQLEGTGPGALHRVWSELIKAITGWLQLIALIVLVVYSVLMYALYRSPDTDPKRILYVVLMLIFFFGVVIALVIDRYLQTVKHEQKDRAIQQTEQAIQDTFESLGKRLLAR